MVRSLHKTKILFAVLFSIITPASMVSFAYADNPQNLDFKVNVAEVLTITVTNPANWASGNVLDFLRNKVSVDASTNNPIGVTVSMYTDLDSTQLRNIISYNALNDTSYIPTLTDAAQGGTNFPVNYWGYSVNDEDTAIPTANYYAMRDRSNPIELFSTVNNATNVGEGHEDVFFGAKADGTKQSGTYAQTVYFAAVTGTIDTDNPSVPVNPSHPNPTTEIASYNSSTGNTTYTQRRTIGSGDTATEEEKTTVTKGDITSAYANAAGVTSSTSGAGDNAALVTALAAGAAVSAVSGLAFFVAAKRKKDDEEG